MYRSAISCLAWALVSAMAGAQQADPLDHTVRVAQGVLKGRPRDARGVLAYHGIPFATPPVGALRWRAPLPAPLWNGIRDATIPGKRCWSNVPVSGIGGKVGAVPQDEDCLTLNIWSAARSTGERRPVMVWLHGGGFQFGTSADPRTDGAVLASEGVVLVSPNYRLGVFGFFAHPQLRSAGRLSGNFGLQDQVAALRWVKDNIAQFGGDPDNVTLVGESAGSQSVSLLMTSPLAKGLFHKAIGQSGSSLQQLPTLGEIGMRGAAYATALGAASVEQLRELSAERINAAAAWDFSGGAPIVFAPGIGGDVLPMPIEQAFRTGLQYDVPLLAGYNKREGYTFLAETLPHRSAAEFRAAAENLVGAANMAQFLALYPADTDAAAASSAEQLHADIRQKAESWAWLNTHAASATSPVYGYYFAYESAYSPVASHVADVAFVFGTLLPQFFAPGSQAAGPADREISRLMRAYWINFASKGDPNGPDLPVWPSLRASHALFNFLADGRSAGAPPSAGQLARFRFLDGMLVSASTAPK